MASRSTTNTSSWAFGWLCRPANPPGCAWSWCSSGWVCSWSCTVGSWWCRCSCAESIDNATPAAANSAATSCTAMTGSSNATHATTAPMNGAVAKITCALAAPRSRAPFTHNVIDNPYPAAPIASAAATCPVSIADSVGAATLRPSATFTSDRHQRCAAEHPPPQMLTEQRRREHHRGHQFQVQQDRRRRRVDAGQPRHQQRRSERPTRDDGDHHGPPLAAHRVDTGSPTNDHRRDRRCRPQVQQARQGQRRHVLRQHRRRRSRRTEQHRRQQTSDHPRARRRPSPQRSGEPGPPPSEAAGEVLEVADAPENPVTRSRNTRQRRSLS